MAYDHDKQPRGTLKVKCVTRTPNGDVSGIKNCEWDNVEYFGPEAHVMLFYRHLGGDKHVLEGLNWDEVISFEYFPATLPVEPGQEEDNGGAFSADDIEKMMGNLGLPEEEDNDG